MESFEILLQNACEDYFASLDHEPTLAEVAEVCSTPIANVVWKALRNASNTRHAVTGLTKDPVINGIKRSRAKEILTMHARSLIGKPVNQCLGSLTSLFKNASTYGYIFDYGTRDGAHEVLAHNEDDLTPITGYSLRLK